MDKTQDYKKWIPDKKWEYDKKKVKAACEKFVEKCYRALEGKNPGKDITKAVYEMLDEMGIDYQGYYDYYAAKEAGE